MMVSTKYLTQGSTRNTRDLIDLFVVLFFRENTWWGAAKTHWLPAQYEDNISLPKGWSPELRVNGHLLPLVNYFHSLCI